MSLRAVGKGIANFLAKQSDLKREDLFITTKLSVQYAEPQFVRDRVTEDLKALGLDYVVSRGIATSSPSSTPHPGMARMHSLAVADVNHCRTFS